MSKKLMVWACLRDAALPVLLFAALMALLLAGCTSTQSTITEYDKDGKITKKTETSESVVETVTKSTKEKTVVAWESGWAAYISASTATTENPTPTVKMFAGKSDKGLVSARPDQQNWSGIAEAINATKYELSVTKDGIGNQSASTAKTAETAKETATETAKATETAANSPTGMSGTSAKAEESTITAATATTAAEAKTTAETAEAKDTAVQDKAASAADQTAEKGKSIEQ